MSTPLQIAVGPELPDFGSWNWLGQGIIDALAKSFGVSVFSNINSPPKADVVIFLKFKPPPDVLSRLRDHSRIVFLPVDVYGSCEEIDADLHSIRFMDHVIVHSRRLSRYFHGNVAVDYYDHPLKYALPGPRQPGIEGPLLWIGRQCNIQPVKHWWRQHRTTGELWILTEMDGTQESQTSLGFSASSNVRVSRWTPEKHLEWTSLCMAAIDIKANDFRSRHKPPAKAYDFAASGVPVISNRGSSADLHLRAYGIVPLDTVHWQAQLTSHYLSNLCERAAQMQTDLTPERIWSRFIELLQCWGPVDEP